jgi:hypothetical protein
LLFPADAKPPQRQRDREHEVIVHARRRLKLGVTVLADRRSERL